MLSMETFTISTGPFSIAMLNYQRVKGGGLDGDDGDDGRWKTRWDISMN